MTLREWRAELAWFWERAAVDEPGTYWALVMCAAFLAGVIIWLAWSLTGGAP